MHALTPLSPTAPHAFADPDLARLGAAIERALLGERRFAELEAEGQAVLLHGAELANAPSSEMLWDLVDRRILSFDDDEIRLVASGPGGLVVVPASAFTVPGLRGQKPIRTPDPSRLRALFAAGASISFQRLDRVVPGLARVAAALSAHLGHPVQCTAYLSPPDCRALDVHHDTHDVLALQLEGTKTFRLFRTIVPQPVPRIDLSPSQIAAAQAVGDATLTRGDLLYLPRGVPHCAATGERHSLHLTIGIAAQAWAAAIEPLASELYFLEPLRRSIATSAIYSPDLLQRDAQLAVEQIIAWLRVFGAERLAAIACERLVASHAGRPDHPDGVNLPVGAVEPAADGTQITITPTGRFRRPNMG